jgi:hypothetical protein
VSLVLTVLWVLLVLLARRVSLVFRVLLVQTAHRALTALWVLRDLRAIRVFLVRPVLRARTVPWVLRALMVRRVPMALLGLPVLPLCLLMPITRLCWVLTV